MHYKNKAEDLYDTLLDKDVKNVIKHLALTKLAEIYKKISKDCEELTSLIKKAINSLEKGKKVNIHDIHTKVVGESLILRHFAVNYSKSLIHASEFADKLSNKIVLYMHK
jgi:hypothetical protein